MNIYKLMFFQIIILISAKASCGDTDYDAFSNISKDFSLPESLKRFARMRCLQTYPQADFHNFTNTHDTQCFLQCFLYKLGLMNLSTRGLDSNKFLDLWDDIDEAFEEKCMDKFKFDEPLSGNCADTYHKLMEYRSHCLELFEFTFGQNSTWNSKEPSKSIGQSASEFCDSIEEGVETVTENSQSPEISFLGHYKSKLECLFQNYHYLDGYGRIDESEIILSYEEAQANSEDRRQVIKMCVHHANGNYHENNLKDEVFELQTCLKKYSPEFPLVSQRRDEVSREY
ncbi:uncharacterized protein LOC101897820 [Musca domestica]|uniref:Uncharacterized protein LOC101897820 n=1 Tax=Musca domestica TaxID=7370 RepID=A0ABM3ULT9_MUSDO|nr:uncharacterized protein LOC101897820 [Musca domestica]